MGLFDMAGSLITTEMQRQNNLQLMQLQRKYNIDMMNYQNEYNLPVNQIQRLKDAGINPGSMLMNQGTSQSGGTSASPLPFTPLPTDFGNIISSIMSSMSNSRLANAKAKTEDLLREERYKSAQLQNQQYIQTIEGLGLDNKAKQIANDYAIAKNEVSLMKDKSDIGLNFWQMSKCAKEIKTMQYELENVLPQNVKESISRTDLNVLEQEKVVAEIERIFYQNAESEQNISESKSREGLNNAQTALTESQEKTEIFKRQNLYADTKNIKLANEDLTNQIKLFLDTYDSQVQRIANDAKISKKQASWFIVNSLLGNAQSAAVTAGAGAMASRAIKGLSTAAKIGF